ncbi:tRNA lysidine(34) synthetase TilS [Candidatus Gracilibacteria bacterium]|nr:MAG: tRNA lysidine(34) synthetase TilS [Candidatus Gracilibacteria bacterium]
MLQQLCPFVSSSPEIDQLFLELEQIFPYPKKAGVAVSGGSDSMFLSYLLVSFFAKKGRNSDFLYFLHCNHAVRPESEYEAQQLEKLFHGWHFEIIKRQEKADPTEENLRNRRYAIFQKKMEEKELEVLFLGHNLTDRIESSLLNMIRGCGIKGFLSMQKMSSHHLLGGKTVVRPLLDLTKQEILSLCTELSIPYFLDKSNFDPDMSLRNLVRNQFLFPLGELKFEDKKNGKERENQLFQSRRQIYAALEERNQKSELIPLALNPLLQVKKAFLWQREKVGKVEKSEIAQLFASLQIHISKGELELREKRYADKVQGYREYPGWTVFLSYGDMYFFQAEAKFWEEMLNQERELTKVGIQNFGPFSLEIKEDMLGGILRFPRENDHFRGKTLKKRMINRKIPIFFRNSVPLVEKGGNIIVVFDSLSFSF